MRKSTILYRPSSSRRKTVYKEYVAAIPPDGGWGWVIVFIAFIIHCFIDGIIMSYGNLISTVMATLELSKPSSALIGAVQTGIYFFMGPLTSAAANQAGFRNVCLFGALVAILGLVLASSVQTHAAVFFGYGIFGGIGFGILIASSLICTSHYFDNYRAIAMGIVLSGTGIGILSLSQVFTYIIRWKGLYVTMQFQILLVAISAFLALFLKPLEPIRLQIQDQRMISRAASSMALRKSLRRFSYVTITDSPVEPEGDISTISRKSSMSISRSSRRSALIRVFDETQTVKPTTFWGKWFHGVCPCLERTSDDSDAQILAGHRPMYRDDIYFQSNLAAVRGRYMDYFDDDDDDDDDEEYHTPKEFSAIEADAEKPTFAENFCPKPIAHALGMLFDISLFKSPVFVCIWLGSVFSMMGAFTTVVYITEKAINHGFHPQTAGLFLSTIGLFNTIARLTSGFVVFCPHSFETAYLVGVLLLICGTVTVISGFCFEYINIYLEFMICALFGLTLALFVALKSFVCVVNLGMQNLTNCFGYIALAQGIGAVIGLPVSGVLYAYTGDTDWSFAFSGIALITAGLCFMPVPTLRRWCKKKTRRIIFVGLNND